MGCLVFSTRVRLSGVHWPHGADQHTALVKEHEGCVGHPKRTDKKSNDVRKLHVWVFFCPLKTSNPLGCVTLWMQVWFQLHVTQKFLLKFVFKQAFTNREVIKTNKGKIFYTEAYVIGACESGKELQIPPFLLWFSHIFHLYPHIDGLNPIVLAPSQLTDHLAISFPL